MLLGTVKHLSPQQLLYLARLAFPSPSTFLHVQPLVRPEGYLPVQAWASATWPAVPVALEDVDASCVKGLKDAGSSNDCSCRVVSTLYLEGRPLDNGSRTIMRGCVR